MLLCVLALPHRFHACPWTAANRRPTHGLSSLLPTTLSTPQRTLHRPCPSPCRREQQPAAAGAGAHRPDDRPGARGQDSGRRSRVGSVLPPSTCWWLGSNSWWALLRQGELCSWLARGGVPRLGWARPGGMPVDAVRNWPYQQRLWPSSTFAGCTSRWSPLRTMWSLLAWRHALPGNQLASLPPTQPAGCTSRWSLLRTMWSVPAWPTRAPRSWGCRSATQT